jgi:hypothetical protein
MLWRVQQAHGRVAESIIPKQDRVFIPLRMPPMKRVNIMRALELLR